jgi:protein-L-isoaspartate(D-aspartate) O-methyltransferase
MTDFALARRNMIDGQLRPNRVTNAQLLAAIGELPRERFLPEATRSVAYADDDVPLGNGRYLMEPMVLARLIQALQPRPEDRAMVVASGPGYGAALLARLVHSVIVVERTRPWRRRPNGPRRNWASPASGRQSANWSRAPRSRLLTT